MIDLLLSAAARGVGSPLDIWQHIVADFSNLGDISTLADPAVVDDLVENRQNRESA